MQKKSISQKGPTSLELIKELSHGNAQNPSQYIFQSFSQKIGEIKIVRKDPKPICYDVHTVGTVDKIRSVHADDFQVNICLPDQ